jgi:hypothetical protein
MSQATSIATSHEPSIERVLAEALHRAQAEFQEMPGLTLTEAQASRLWAFDSALVRAVLSTLVERGFLVRSRLKSSDPVFVRA